MLAVLVYAYGFEKTNVDLSELQSETRQDSLVRILRTLARPELLTYETVPTTLEAQYMSPCPAGGFAPPAPDTSGPYITLEPTCVEPGGAITVTGFGFGPDKRGDLFYKASTGATIRLGNFQTDGEGSFTTVVDTRERESDQPQIIQAVTTVTVGSIWNWERVPTGEIDPETGEAITVMSPRLSATTIDTWDKIIETVFLALIATTAGLILAVPLSFFAARNIMRDVRIPMAGLSIGLLGAIAGAGVGLLVADVTREAADALIGNSLAVLAGLVVVVVVTVAAMRWAFPGEEDDRPPASTRFARFFAAAGGVLLSIIGVFLTAELMVQFGDWLADRLGTFDFLGTFVQNVGEITTLLTGTVTVIGAALLFMFLGSRFGSGLRSRLPDTALRPLNVLLAAAAGATLAVLIAQGLAWLYEITAPSLTLWWPAAIGGAIGAGMALLAGGKATVNTGLSIYYLARTVFNAIRAIEPLVIVIVFVVWVGLGPFAGALALALHTTAALAKLYSEQVESIGLGPIEAIKATGATRMQTIVYAVVPQIVPPYISFTMYRWDINVRVSTIIGFAGGGGIGFVLFQNINLRNYDAAAVQMLAIAIVVASMDYISSRLRERFV